MVLGFTATVVGAENRVPISEIDLRDGLENLPYQARIVPRTMPTNQDRSTDNRSFLFLDYNSDGHDDLVRANSQGLVIEDLADSNRILQTVVLDPVFAQPGRPAFRLSHGPDLNGDGRREIIAIGHTQNQMRWQLWVLDASDLEVISITSLPPGTDLRQDGRWDGIYRHATRLPATTGNQESRIIVTCEVGHDQDGRGVLAIDPLAGRVVWQHEVAGMVHHRSLVGGDFDQDGRHEIVMAVASSNLPRSRTVNGYRDDESYIVVLNEDGSRRWSHAIAKGYGGCAAAVVDADGDGQTEVIAVHWSLPVPAGGMYAWNMAGELTAAYKSDQPMTGINVLAGAVGDQPDLLVTTSRGDLAVFQLRGNQLTDRLRFAFPYGCVVNGVVDLLPEAGPEVIVTDKAGRVVILGADLQPMAQIETTALSWRGTAGTVDVDSGRREMYRIGMREGTVAFDRLPVVATRPNLTTLLALAGTLLMIVWMVFRRQRIPTLNIRHEVRLHLLESLELSGHGDIAPLNAVRRLNFCLRALLADIGDNSRVKIRLSEILTECQEVSLPHLTGIADRARLAHLEAQSVAAADSAIKSVSLVVQKLVATEDKSQPSEELIAELGTAEKNAEESLRALRNEVARFFMADPQQSIERVLLANKDRMQDNGVSVDQAEKAMAAAGGSTEATTVAPSPMNLPAGTCCLIDPVDLDVVLDNLVANATTAMSNSQQRQLRIDQRLIDGMVMIDVTDTGCGIATANQERALNTHYSTKSGGGSGLPASRKILRRYGGQVSILRSEPGQGTTVRITTIAG